MTENNIFVSGSHIIGVSVKDGVPHFECVFGNAEIMDISPGLTMNREMLAACPVDCMCGFAKELKRKVSKEKIFCHACGITTDLDTLFEGTDTLSDKQREQCVSPCGFACYP